MKRALILSPFATAPLDAGHRRRVFQMTDLLRRRGYRITLLVYAFEAGWAWGFEDQLYADMAAQWDEVIVFHADQKVGRPPEAGRLHALDEWWNPELGPVLTNLLSRRFFDVFVVHNVWLSKAFDFAPRRTIKVVETHDLFWLRREMYDRLGVGNDFFLPSRDDELFGINRADVAVMIQEAEARNLVAACSALVVTVPFFDAALEKAAEFQQRSEYLSPHKVTFGFLGSAHVFNVRGMQAVLDALEVEIGRSFAPVDLVVGGTVRDHLYTDLPLQRIKHVPSEASLYRRCDFAIAPNFDGTGFKVKVADCLALGVPTLAAAHAATGTSIAPQHVADTPGQMAALMVRISLTRPDLASANAAVIDARADLRRRTALGAFNFANALKTLLVVTVLDLRAFDLAAGLLPLIGYLSLSRHIAAGLPVIVILADEVAPLVAALLPGGVRAMAASAASPKVLAELRKRVLDASATGGEGLGVGLGDRYIIDTRWTDAGCADPDWADAGSGVMGERQAGAGPDGAVEAIPLLHPDITWEPAVAELRKRWQRLSGAVALPAGPIDTIVYVDHVSAQVPSGVFQLAGVVWMLNTRRDGDFAASVLKLIDAGHGTMAVVWGSSNFGTRHRLVMEICAQRNFSFHGGTAGGSVIAAVPSMGDGNVGARLTGAVERAFTDSPTPAEDRDKTLMQAA